MAAQAYRHQGKGEIEAAKLLVVEFTRGLKDCWKNFLQQDPKEKILKHSRMQIAKRTQQEVVKIEGRLISLL